MANYKKSLSGIPYKRLCLSALVLFCACAKVPEHCSDHNPLDPLTEFCYEGLAYSKCGADSTFDQSSKQCVKNADLPTPTTYTLTVNRNPANGGTTTPASSQSNISAGTQVNITAAAASGYTFKNWTISGSGTLANANNASTSVTVNGAVTVTANFTQNVTNPTTYTVSYNINGGSGTTPTAQTVNAGSSVTLPSGSELTKSGYTFGGWNTNNSGTGTNYTGSSFTPTGPTSSITLYAKWNVVSTIDVSNIEMVSVAGGTFTMGCTSEQGSDCYSDERPSHSVTLSDFSIGKYEVTQGLWKAVMGSNPSHFTGDDNLPVESVSWNDVQTFIQKLNEKTDGKYRLPTEAEWEYAARGGNSSGGYKYSGSDTIGDVAWYWDNIPSQTSGATGYGTQPVGTKRANELGIYDMSGNVREWVNDWHESSYGFGAQTNPTGPSTGSYRELRGGSWRSVASICRVSFRYHDYPTSTRHIDLGFRLARSP